MNLNGTISSQYVSSVFICAPYAQKEVTLKLKKGKVSPGYITMTIQLLKQFWNRRERT
eukprot:UN05699